MDLQIRSQMFITFDEGERSIFESFFSARFSLSCGYCSGCHMISRFSRHLGLTGWLFLLSFYEHCRSFPHWVFIVVCRSKTRLRATSLFWLVRRAKRPRHAHDHARDRRRETGEERQKRSLFSSRAVVLVSRVSRLRRSTLVRTCTPLTKSEEKERLLAV